MPPGIGYVDAGPMMRRPPAGRADFSAGLAGGGGIEDFIAQMRGQLGDTGRGGGGMQALPGGGFTMGPSGPTMGAPGFQARPLPAPGGPGGGALPFRPPPSGMTAPGAAPPGAPTGGAPIATQEVDAPAPGAGGPTSSPASPGPMGGSDAAFARISSPMGRPAPDKMTAAGPGITSGPAKTPGWQSAGFDSRRDANQARKAAGVGGTLQKFIQGKIGEQDEGPRIEALPAPAVAGRFGGVLGTGGSGLPAGSPTPGPLQAQAVDDAAAGSGARQSEASPGSGNGNALAPRPAGPTKPVVPGSRDGLVAPKPARIGGTDADFERLALPAQVTGGGGIARAGFDDRRAANKAFKASGAGGTLKNWLADQTPAPSVSTRRRAQRGKKV